MIYFFIKIFLKIVTLFFFQDIEVINQHRTPQKGAVILCGNHSNQFVDPMLIISNCNRETSFLIAESVISIQSFKKKVVGTFAKYLHAIPVKRPQDYVYLGTGLISWNDQGFIQGKGTKFTEQLKPGDNLKVSSETIQIKQISSDLILIPASPCKELNNQTYKIVPKIDQSDMFDTVQDELKNGRCIGIFPEGGSHDRTTLLPLKAGVCLMALGAMVRHNIEVSIQCIGLNYYKGHQFRSRAIVNFGLPYPIPRQIAEIYKNDRAKAVAMLLKQIENHLSEVWTVAPSYEELQDLILARKLYKPDEYLSNPQIDLKLDLRFAKAYKYLRENNRLGQITDILQGIRDYNEDLSRIGLKDSQLRQSERISTWRMILYSVVTITRIFLGFIISLPGWLISGAILYEIAKRAQIQREKALKNSSVKIHGYDVLASYKLVYGTVIFFGVICVGGFLLFSYYWVYSDWWTAVRNLSLYSVMFPIYLYVCIVLSDRASNHAKRLKLRLLSICSPQYIDFLKSKRSNIKGRINQVVHQYGPEVFPGLQPGKIFKKYGRDDLELMMGDSFGLLEEIGIQLSLWCLVDYLIWFIEEF